VNMNQTQIRDAIINRMRSQTAMPDENVSYPNDPVFDASGMDIWARLSNVTSSAGANEIGNGPVVQRTGIVTVQLFVPIYNRTLALSLAADKIVELFQFQNDGKLSYFSSSIIDAGETDGWYQWNVQTPYRAL